MANADIPNGFKVEHNQYGQAAVMHFPMAASQTIAKGDAVILASGLVEIAVATSPQLLGIAEESRTTTGSVDREDTIAVTVALPGIIFSGQVSGDSTAALVGTATDIEGTTGIMEVNENATTEDVIQIVALSSDKTNDLTLGTNDRVEFIILRSQFYPALAAK